MARPQHEKLEHWGSKHTRARAIDVSEMNMKRRHNRTYVSFFEAASARLEVRIDEILAVEGAKPKQRAQHWRSYEMRFDIQWQLVRRRQPTMTIDASVIRRTWHQSRLLLDGIVDRHCKVSCG